MCPLVWSPVSTWWLLLLDVDVLVLFMTELAWLLELLLWRLGLLFDCGSDTDAVAPVAVPAPVVVVPSADVELLKYNCCPSCRLLNESFIVDAKL